MESATAPRLPARQASSAGCYGTIRWRAVPYIARHLAEFPDHSPVALGIAAPRTSIAFDPPPSARGPMTAAHAEVLLDAHVHYHPGFSKAVFFAAAAANLRAGRGQLDLDGSPRSGIMLAESHGVDAFGEFAEQAATGLPGGTPPDGWWFRRTEEDNSLWAVRSSAPDQALLVIAGRQLVTREGLEVLALGCREPLAEGMELRAARDAVIEAGGVPVVPWGFGKWWSQRGRVVAALVDAGAAEGAWFLGDNAGRPQLSRRPPMFARAAARGVFVLPGSDPLPLPGQADKVGRCGFQMSIELDADHPARAVLDGLRGTTEQPPTFGRYESLGNFVRDQVAMQRRKRSDRSETASS